MTPAVLFGKSFRPQHFLLGQVETRVIISLLELGLDLACILTLLAVCKLCSII